MRKSLNLSAIALLTTALTVLPAHALSLNLGGDGPLVDLGNGKSADATVSVDTGNVLGDDGTDAGAAIDVNLSDVGGANDNLGNIIDNDGDGGLVNLGGDDDLIDLSGDGDSVIDLGGDGDLLDLGGDGDLLDFGGDGGLLDLGGDGGLVDIADLDLGDGPLLDLGGSGVVDLDLGETGSIPGRGGNGSIGGSGTGGGSGGASGLGNGGSGSSSGDDLFAATNGTNACLTLTAAQLDELIQRHAYNRATFNSWANARSLKIVEVDVCDRAVAEVEAAAGGSANVGQLQAFLAAQAKVRAGLQSKGYSSGDVIAADHSGDVLIVYVI